MENSFPKYVTRAAIDGLVEKLGLPEPHMYSQDWEIEITNSSRVSELISAYENSNLNHEEKFALMIVIVGSYDDALSAGMENSDNWDKISYHLVNELNIHKNTILYWASEGQELENCFYIAPLMRDLMKKNDIHS